MILNAHQSTWKPAFWKIVCTLVFLNVHVVNFDNGFISSFNSSKRLDSCALLPKWTITPSRFCGFNGTREPSLRIQIFKECYKDTNVWQMNEKTDLTADSMKIMFKSTTLSGHKSFVKIPFRFSTRPKSVKWTQLRFVIFISILLTGEVFPTISNGMMMSRVS